jgi:hypothetical protein
MGYKRKPLINAPVEIRNLPFNLKRSHLYPVWPELIEQAILDYQGGAPLPVARLQVGAYMPPYRNAVAGVQALEDARQQREDFRNSTGLSHLNSAQIDRIKALTTVHTGNGSFKRIQHAVLGPHYREIPFQPRSDIPAELRAASNSLYQAWRGNR